MYMYIWFFTCINYIAISLSHTGHWVLGFHSATLDTEQSGWGGQSDRAGGTQGQYPVRGLLQGRHAGTSTTGKLMDSIDH